MVIEWWELYKKFQGNFQGDENVCYPDSGDDFMHIHMSKLIKLHTLNMCSLMYINYALIKLKKFKYENIWLGNFLTFLPHEFQNHFIKVCGQPVGICTQ